MDIAFIIIAIVLGIMLVFIEILFVPGTTVVGILGFVLIGAGVYYTYNKFGVDIGNYTLIGTALVSFGAIFYGFRSGTWKFLANDQVLDSKVNEDVDITLKVGDVGKSVSALRPMGTAEFNDDYVEVATLGAFVEAQKEIRIIAINNREITVEAVDS